MPSNRRRAAWILGLLVAAAIPLIPDPPAPVERSPDLDIELVRSAQVRFRGITASFDEVTRAYALTAYEGAELEGWSAWPNPRHPDTEALVRARFHVDGARDDTTGLGREAASLRRDAGATLDITWRLNTLASAQVQPHDGYARDALDVFRRTVDDLLGRMVYVLEDAELLDAPDGVAAAALQAGSVLMREARQGRWVRVRVPSDTAAGWILGSRLHPVSAEGSD